MRVLEICVLPAQRRIELVVEMPDPDRFHTAQVPHLPRRLFRLIPTLADHRCENDLGVSFRKECHATEIPHLFEHLIIELQAQAQSVSSLKGETRWNWQVDPRGHFHVWVEYENELLAVAAIRLAERILNALDGRHIAHVDIEQEMARLREIAVLGRNLTAPPSAGSAAPSDAAAESSPRSWASVRFAGF